jgi:hypothetical protein
MPYGTFEESQKFRQAWIWFIIAGVNAIMIYQLFFSDPDVEIGSIHVLVLFVIIGVDAIFFFGNLKTRINNDNIQITFFPFINKPKVISWNSIDKAYIRRYNSFTEYGGWGIRRSWKGRAYNTSGNIGLQLVLKSGRKTLIGTQKQKELEEFLEKYVFKDKDEALS